MKNLKFLKALLVICFSITLLSCSSEDTAPVETNQQPTTVKNYTHSAYEVELLDLVNQDRVSKRLNALIITSEISYVASTHTDYMISKDVTSHDNFEQRVQTLKSSLNAISVSENVAVGYTTAAATLAAWNASEEHRANLEGNYTHYGLSVKPDSNGKKYYTLIFIRK